MDALTYSPEMQHILGANNATLSYTILQIIYDEITHHNGTVIRSTLNFMKHYFHILHKFCVGINARSLEYFHIQFQQDRQCMQHEMHTSLLYCLNLSYVSTLFHKRHDFRNNVTGKKKCVLISFRTFVWNTSHSKKNWATYNHKCILVFM
jgi:hypothetical protein